jgi:hypothetical protein
MYDRKGGFMKISESCANCLYDRQRARTQDEAYLAEVRRLLEERAENDPSPLLVYRFNQAYAAASAPGTVMPL